MLIPINWLREYVAVGEDINEYCDKMIMSGSNLETVKYMDKNIENVVIGKILKITKHPDADKLKICEVNVGEEIIQIVTGAENVKEGVFVIVALHNSRIPGPLHGQKPNEEGVKIKKGKLRGVESMGMLCSMGEMGFPDKVIPQEAKDGIWLLDGEWEVGKPVIEALQLNEVIVDFEITPNRPDCLSMLGMARETGATLKENVTYPKNENKVNNDNKDFDIEIKSENLCSRYAAKLIKNVEIKPSPWWIQKRLMAVGIRPINNIVDITNYVMTEYGQPLHAFDFDSISGNRIIIDELKENEKVITLDSTEREIPKGTLVISDEEKILAIAGVMGLENSEVKKETKNILLESANFDNVSIRNTSKYLALRTEASSKFEKGLDPEMCNQALERACELIEMLSCGNVQAEKDVYTNVKQSKSINIRPERINQVLGINLPTDEMIEILNRLEIETEIQKDTIKVTAPTLRSDLEIEEDYIEEVARFYGYDNLPNTLPKGNNQAQKTKERNIQDKLKGLMCVLGLNEVQTYSFCSQKSFEKVNIDNEAWEHETIKIRNPLGEETGVLRTILTPSMMEILSNNYKKNVQNVRAYEIGNTFVPDYIEVTAIPTESINMVIGIYGENEDFFSIKGVIENILEHLGIDEVSYEVETEYGVYHPGRCARIIYKENDIGIFGEVHPKVTKNYGIETRCYCCEMFLDEMIKISDKSVKYKTMPKYPAMTRDIALVVDEEKTAGFLEKIIKDNGSKILKEVELFDIYRGKQVEAGKKSMAYKLTYRSDFETLTDKEVSLVHDKILKKLEEVGASLREA